MRHLTIAAVAWLFLLTTSARASSFSVDDWTLITAILDDSSGEIVTVGGSFTEVANPFVSAHGGNLPPPSASTTFASYVCAWNEQSGTGSFDISTSHSLEGVAAGSAFVVTSGSIFLNSTVDLTLEIDAEYSYQLPVDPMFSDLVITVVNVDDLIDLYGESESYDTIFGAPAAGTFNISDQVVLPAGQPLALLYSMRIRAFAGSAGDVGTGEGFVHFNLQPVPEPATLFLLPWAAFAIRHAGPHRRRKQSRRPPPKQPG